ncbi:hypothetical protein PO909_001966 [Leuciscus waleckii]
MMDYAHRQSSPATFQPIAFHPKDKPFLPPPDIHTPLAITITSAHVPKHKISKTNTHPLTSSSAFKVWDPNKSHVQHQVPLMAQPPLSQPNSRRQAFTNKRQFSIETLPELFTQPLGYGQSPHLHPKHKGLPTNSKTEMSLVAQTHVSNSKGQGPYSSGAFTPFQTRPLCCQLQSTKSCHTLFSARRLAATLPQNSRGRCN